jgi:hypothetical protein
MLSAVCCPSFSTTVTGHHQTHLLSIISYAVDINAVSSSVSSQIRSCSCSCSCSCLVVWYQQKTGYSHNRSSDRHPRRGETNIIIPPQQQQQWQRSEKLVGHRQRVAQQQPATRPDHVGRVLVSDCRARRTISVIADRKHCNGEKKGTYGSR